MGLPARRQRRREAPLNPRQKNGSRGDLLAIGSANLSRRAKHPVDIGSRRALRAVGFAEGIEDDRYKNARKNAD
jgi:hypothetical protein